MRQGFIDRSKIEEARGQEKWGRRDRTPNDLMTAAMEELGEVAHALQHEEGAEKIQEEVTHVVGILSRLYTMAGGI